MSNIKNFDRILLIDKPSGITSFGVVARIRRKLSEEAGHKIKVGHTGTLDPFATGLLILMTGKNTKKCQDFLKLDKTYEATLMLGKTSTTGDPEGEITSTFEPKSNALVAGQTTSPITPATLGAPSAEVPPSEADVTAVIESFVGEIEQKPPRFSAIKINGQRAYKLARKGETPEMPTRKVKIYGIEILSYDFPTLKIRCHVSSGTYIRTLAEDIGKKLGTGAYLTTLRRLKIGEYDLEDAMPLNTFGISD